MDRFEQVLFQALSQVMSEVWHQTEQDAATLAEKESETVQ